jgi:predicted  nucleic acid-binding Zn-ribbon protein
MNIKQLDQVKTVEEARQLAIEWQNWASDNKMYMSELAEWQQGFEALALNLDVELAEEFKENGII